MDRQRVSNRDTRPGIQEEETARLAATLRRLAEAALFFRGPIPAPSEDARSAPRVLAADWDSRRTGGTRGDGSGAGIRRLAVPPGGRSPDRRRRRGREDSEPGAGDPSATGGRAGGSARDVPGGLSELGAAAAASGDSRRLGGRGRCRPPAG